jgi:hypothetical protein
MVDNDHHITRHPEKSLEKPHPSDHLGDLERTERAYLRLAGIIHGYTHGKD